MTGRAPRVIDRAMTQNIYDDDGFFAGYSQLPRSVEGLDAAPEWPALRALLPDLRGRAVLDLGCEVQLVRLREPAQVRTVKRIAGRVGGRYWYNRAFGGARG